MVEPVVDALVVGVAAVVGGVVVPATVVPVLPATVVLVLPGTVVVVPALVVGVGPSCWTTGRKVSRPVWPMSARARFWSATVLRPGSSTTTVLPDRTMFGSPTPRPFTRAAMTCLAPSISASV